MNSMKLKALENEFKKILKSIRIEIKISPRESRRLFFK